MLYNHIFYEKLKYIKWGGNKNKQALSLTKVIKIGKKSRYYIFHKNNHIQLINIFGTSELEWNAMPNFSVNGSL